MKDLEKKYNVIMTDEDFVGKISDLKNYFIESLADFLQKKDVYIVDKEFTINITDEILGILNDCEDEETVRVIYNPMGSYYISRDI